MIILLIVSGKTNKINLLNTMKKILIFVIFIVFVLAGFNIFQDKEIIGSNIEEISEQIIIPVRIHIVAEPSGVYTTSRTEKNILNLLEKANQIWIQGNIHFQIEEIVITDLSFGAIPNILNGNHLELSNHENFDENKINLFLVQNLNNINGIALKDINSALVSDYTTVNDFRTTAHEFGHLLSLGHVNPSNMLMARGRNGELLSSQEILIARNYAINLY